MGISNANIKTHFSFVIIAVITGLLFFLFYSLLPYVKYENKDGKIYEFEKAKISIKWFKYQNGGLLFPQLTVFEDDVFTVEHIADKMIDDNNYAYFIVIKKFTSFKKDTAYIEYLGKLIIEHDFILLYKGRKVASFHLI